MERNLPAWAASYIGLPYRTHGRDRSGVDCWGLVRLVQAEQLGSLWPPYEGVDWFKGQRPAVIGSDAIAYASKFKSVTPGAEQLGDGILLRMRGHPFHVGLVLAPAWMLHTHEQADSCVENYRSMLWERRISGFYRYEAA
jgi:hypothetical protein